MPGWRLPITRSGRGSNGSPTRSGRSAPRTSPTCRGCARSSRNPRCKLATLGHRDRTPPRRARAWLAASLLAAACSRDNGLPFAESALVINEVMSDNEGACIDNAGEADDYIELANTGDVPVELSVYALSDKSGTRAQLPRRELAPGETVLFFADGAPEQGASHLPFKLSASGDRVVLRTAI